MKPIYNSSSKTIVKSLCNVSFLFLVTLLLSSLFTSCTTDEIEVKPKNIIIEETFLQRNDSIWNDSIPDTNSNSTNNVEIDPVKSPPPPPPPSNP